MVTVFQFGSLILSMRFRKIQSSSQRTSTKFYTREEGPNWTESLPKSEIGELDVLILHLRACINGAEGSRCSCGCILVIASGFVKNLII